jgi:hypothetical protein
MDMKARIIDKLAWIRFYGFGNPWEKKADLALAIGMPYIGFESVEYSPEFNQALEDLVLSGDVEFKHNGYWGFYLLSDEKYESYIQEPQFTERI